MPRSPSKPRSSAGGRPQAGARLTDRRPRQERRFAEGAGRRGEFWAELFLRAQFYRVLETEHANVLKELGESKNLTDELAKALDDALVEFRESFLA